MNIRDLVFDENILNLLVNLKRFFTYANVIRIVFNIFVPLFGYVFNFCLFLRVFFYYFPFVIQKLLLFIKKILYFIVNITKNLILKFTSLFKHIIFIIVSCSVDFFYNIMCFNQNLHLVEKIFLQKNKPTQVFNNHTLLEEDNSVNIDEQDPEMVIKKRKKVFLKIESFNSANEIYIRMLEPVDGFLYHYR
jgi:hypothetical protein